MSSNITNTTRIHADMLVQTAKSNCPHAPADGG